MGFLSDEEVGELEDASDTELAWFSLGAGWAWGGR